MFKQDRDEPMGIRPGTPDHDKNSGADSQRYGIPSWRQPATPQAGRNPWGNRDEPNGKKVHFDDRQREVTREEEEVSWGPVGNFLWYVVAGGKECCAMRTKPQDPAAVTKAADSCRLPLPRSRFDSPARRDERDEPDDRNGYGDTPPFSGRNDKSRDGDLRENDSLDRGIRDPPRDTAFDRDPYVRGWAPGRGGEDPSSRGGDDRSRNSRCDPCGVGASHAPGNEGEPLSMDPSGPGSSRKPLAPSTARSQRWEWPAWCLNFKTPCIEVYVLDDETGRGRWVDAEPQSRVVDKAGKDAYLCVEYDWDGEYYVQDFGPQHVRRRGYKQTVFDAFNN